MLLEKRTTQGNFWGARFYAAAGLFSDLTPEALKALARIKQIERVPKGAVLLAKRETPRGIYMLVKGSAQLMADAEFNNNQIIRPVEPDEMLGLTEMIAGLPYKLLVKTDSACVFEFIDREDFIQFLRREPDVCFRLLQLLAQACRNTTGFAAL